MCLLVLTPYHSHTTQHTLRIPQHLRRSCRIQYPDPSPLNALLQPPTEPLGINLRRRPLLANNLHDALFRASQPLGPLILFPGAIMMCKLRPTGAVLEPILAGAFDGGLRVLAQADTGRGGVSPYLAAVVCVGEGLVEREGEGA